MFQLKTLTLNTIAISIIVFMLVLNFAFPRVFQTLDDTFRDYMFLQRGASAQSHQVVIVDIDEKSLAALGQWPWGRDTMATIIQHLKLAGADVIGLDILFSEPDRTSPSNITKKYQLAMPNTIDHDQMLADAITSANVVLGYFLNFTQAINTEQYPNVSANIWEEAHTQGATLKATGVLLNIDQIQNSTPYNGFINTNYESGMVRVAPLVIKYNDILFPSLALEMYRVHQAVEDIAVRYNPVGIDSLELDRKFLTDTQGRLHINYRGPDHTFTYVSAVDAYHNTFKPADIRNKAVLIGTTATGLHDLRVTPFDDAFPGVEVHANILDNLIVGDYLYQPLWATMLADPLMVIGIIFMIRLFFSHFSAPYLVLALAFTLTGVYGLYYWILFEFHIILNNFYPLVSVILMFFALLVINYIYIDLQQRHIREKFAKKVSIAVVEDILQHNHTDILAGVERNISIFFSDIRGFTSISEALSAKEVINLLNIYMTPMSDIIMHRQGTIDKFIGDAIMAYWNAPKDVIDHPDQAVLTALEQLQTLAQVNQTLQERFQISVDIGIGINSGLAVVGEMGSTGRSDYTVIGDMVNIASRLEGLNKLYGTRIIISENTLNGLKGTYILRELDYVTVKGKAEPIAIYEVIGQGHAAPDLARELAAYHTALQHYRAGDFATAGQCFEALLAQATQSILYQTYIQRCQQFMQTPPALPFDYAHSIASK